LQALGGGIPGLNPGLAAARAHLPVDLATGWAEGRDPGRGREVPLWPERHWQRAPCGPRESRLTGKIPLRFWNPASGTYPNG